MSNSVLGMKKSGNKHSTSSYAVLLVTLFAMAFFGVCNPQSFQGGLGGVAGSVDDLEITNNDFSRAYQWQSNRLRQQYGENFDSKEMRIAALTFDQLVKDRVLYVKAEELGLKAADIEVARSLTSQIDFGDEKGNFSDEKFQQALRANHMSEAMLMNDQRRFLSVQKLREFIMKTAFVSKEATRLDYKISETKFNLEYLKFDPNNNNLTFSQDEMKSYLAKEGNEAKVKGWYDSHTSDYQKPEQVKARHILISYQGAQSATTSVERSKEQAKKLAEDIHKEVTAPGAKFEAVARAKTDEPNGKETAGELGYFTREAMVKPFSDAAFALKKNEISGVVETPFGFHIIEVLDKKEAINTTFAEAKDEIIQKLLKREKAPEITQKNAERALSLIMEGDESLAKFLAEQKVEWKQTGTFQVGARNIPGIGSSTELLDIITNLNPQTKETHDKVIKVERSYYIVRLLEVQNPKQEDLSDEKMKQMATSSMFSEAYTNFAAYENRAVKEFEAQNRIYRNPAYLALDQQTNEGAN